MQDVADWIAMVSLCSMPDRRTVMLSQKMCTDMHSDAMAILSWTIAIQSGLAIWTGAEDQLERRGASRIPALQDIFVSTHPCSWIPLQTQLGHRHFPHPQPFQARP